VKPLLQIESTFRLQDEAKSPEKKKPEKMAFAEKIAQTAFAKGRPQKEGKQIRPRWWSCEELSARRGGAVVPIDMGTPVPNSAGQRGRHLQ